MNDAGAGPRPPLGRGWDRAIVEAATDAITVQDLRGEVVWANAAAARLMGYASADELLAAGREAVMKRFELFDETGAPIPRAELPMAAVFGGAESAERVVGWREGARGELRLSTVRSTAAHDEAGARIGVINTFREITAQRRAETALRTSEAHLATTLRSIGDAVITTDGQGRVAMLNAVASDLTGWREEEARGRPLEEVFQIVNEETGLPIAQPFERVRLEGAVLGLANHTLLVRRDGRQLAIADSAAPIRGEDGRPDGIVVVFRDETEARRRTRRELFLADAAQLLHGSLDLPTMLESLAHLTVPRLADWCAIHVVTTDGAVEVAQVAHRDPDKTHWAWELTRRYPPDPRNPHGAYEVIRTGRATFMPDVEDEHLRAAAHDEEHLAILRSIGFRSAIVVPIPGLGTTLGAISLVAAESRTRYGASDVELAKELARRAGLAFENARLYAEAREAQELERRARRDAEHAGRLKDQFLATISHELRTPLNAVLGWVALLLEDAPDVEPGTLLKGLHTIERNARLQAQLVDDLLDLSRLQRGAIQLSTERVDLVDLARQALEALTPAAVAKDIRLSLESGAAIRATVDPLRVQQILANLVGNAVKFTPPGGAIAVRVREEAGGVVLEVEDSGRGIEQDFLPHVFEVFRQGDQSIKRAHGGLGLGLAIVKSLVELHGGEISAHSEGPGHGARFRVRLPRIEGGHG